MAEKVEKKVEDVVDEQIDETEVEETETVQEQDKTQKGFDQAQVNRIVQSRLKKVKAEYDNQLSDLQTQLESYESVISKMIEKQIGVLDAPTQKLLKKLSVVEQLEFLGDSSNFEEVASKKVMPKTPASNNNVQEKKDTKPATKFRI